MEAAEQLQIVGVDRIDGDQLMVEFSDQTQSLFTIEQLLSLNVKRSASDTAY